MLDTPIPIANRFDFPDGNWQRAIIIAVIFGAVGGLAAEAQLLAESDRSSRSESTTPRAKTGSDHKFLDLVFDIFRHGQFGRLLMTAFVGSATAVCGLFVVLVSAVISGLGSGALWAFLAAISTTLGIASDRILPSIQNDVFKRLGFLEKQLDSNRRSINANAGLDATERALDDALSGAAVKSIIDQGATTASTYLRNNPRARRPTIRLARLHFEKLADKPGAIAVLTRFIKYLEAHINADDIQYKKDLSDSYYNRACYWLTSPRSDQESTEEYTPNMDDIKLGVADLKKSIAIYPQNIEDARSDRDFNWIKKNNSEIGDLLK